MDVEKLRYVVAADLGQANDPTAVAVVERRLVPAGERHQHTWRDPGYGHEPERLRFEVRQKVEQRYDVVRLDRVPLRTSYAKVAKGLVKLAKEFYAAHIEDEDYEGGPVHVGLALDATGVGRAVLEMVYKEVRERIKHGEPHILWRPVVATAGDTVTSGGGFYRVPKRDLITAGIVAYPGGRLRVGKLRHRDTLEQELTNYRLKQNAVSGHDTYSPLREGAHDDLLFATCLGLWTFERGVRKQEYRRWPHAWLAG